MHRESKVERERNQQDAAILMFIINLSQHVSDITMPIVRRTRLCTTVYGVQHWSCEAGTQACVPAPHDHGQHNQC